MGFDWQDEKDFLVLAGIKHFYKLNICKINTQIKLKEIRKQALTHRIKVLFYVTENQKWGYQSLYETFAADERFEVLVVVGVLIGVHKGKDTTRKNLEENYTFFKSRNMNVEYGYKDNKYVCLKEFKPDIVFYEQPWGLPEKHKPWNVSKYALTAYCPYAYQLFKNISSAYKHLPCYVYKYFLTHELNYKRLARDYKNIENAVVVGYPKLDTYLEPVKDNKVWKSPEKTKIIYAPHHSFESSGLKLATFRENGKLILEWAKSHPETTWIFKPHPQFKYTLMTNNIMSTQEIEEYYEEWSKIAIIYEQGDYFDIFKSSDLMITDCGSFLAEYLPTKKPLIRPINSESIELNEIGQLVTREYYCTKDNQELLNVLEEVVVNGNDYKKEERIKLASETFDFQESSASKIYKGFLEIVK